MQGSHLPGGGDRVKLLLFGGFGVLNGLDYLLSILDFLTCVSLRHSVLNVITA